MPPTILTVVLIGTAIAVVASIVGLVYIRRTRRELLERLADQQADELMRRVRDVVEHDEDADELTRRRRARRRRGWGLAIWPLALWGWGRNQVTRHPALVGSSAAAAIGGLGVLLAWPVTTDPGDDGHALPVPPTIRLTAAPTVTVDPGDRPARGHDRGQQTADDGHTPDQTDGNGDTTNDRDEGDDGGPTDRPTERPTERPTDEPTTTAPPTGTPVPTTAPPTTLPDPGERCLLDAHLRPRPLHTQLALQCRTATGTEG